MDLQDWISSSVALFYIIPLILYLFTNQTFHLKGWLGLLSTLGLSEMLKNDFVKESNPRPKGARNCNLLCNDGNQEGKPGMPSGHSSTVTFFTSFYYQQTSNPWIKGFLVVYAILVMASRYIKRCHSLQQIGAGSMLGFFMSWLVVRMM